MGFLHAIESAEKLLASIDYDGRAAYGRRMWRLVLDDFRENHENLGKKHLETIPWRIHGAGIYANIGGILMVKYVKCYTIYAPGPATPPLPPPHGMGPILRSSPSPPVVWWGCGTVPLPPLWCGGGVVWYVGYVWCVWWVWYGMFGKYGCMVGMVCMACMFAIVCMVGVAIMLHMYGICGMYDRYDRYGMHGIIGMYGRYGIC